MFQRVLLLVSTVVLSSCAYKLECAKHGGPYWTELQTPHFIIRSDVSVQRTRMTAEALERSYVALSRRFSGVPAQPRPIRVVLLKNTFQIEALVGVRARSMVGSGPLGPQFLISGDDYATGALIDQVQINRALAVHFERYAFHRLPMWVGFGYADYLSAINVDPRTTVAFAQMRELVSRWGVHSIDELWAWDDIVDMDPGDNLRRSLSAWMTISYLMSAKRSETDRFMDDLKAGMDPREAWANAFPGLTAEQLLAGVNDHLFRGKFTRQIVEVADIDGSAFVERDLPDAVVHATLVSYASPERAAKDLAAAIAIDEGNPEVLMTRILASHDPAQKLELSRTMTEAYPQSAIAHLLLARSLSLGTPERLRELEEAVRLDSTLAVALAELALEVVHFDVARGLSLAERAATLAPYTHFTLEALAAVKAVRGSCLEAHAALERATDFSRGDREALASLAQHALRLERCR